MTYNKKNLLEYKKTKKPIQITYRANGFIHCIGGFIGTLSADCFVFILAEEIFIPINYDRLLDIKFEENYVYEC
jgi:hypothetical protein